MKFLSLRTNCFWSFSATITSIRDWTPWKEMNNWQFSGSEKAAIVSVQICWQAPGKWNDRDMLYGKDTVVGLQRVREWVSIKACCLAQQWNLIKLIPQDQDYSLLELDYLWTICSLMASAHAPSPHASPSPMGIHWSHKLHPFHPVTDSSRVLEICADFADRDSNYIY